MGWLLLLLLAAPASAQVPLCIPEREGMLHCFESRLCRCRFDPGGQLAGRPPGHRWDCGPLRPDCRAPDPPPPATPWLPPPQLFLDARPPVSR